MQSIVLHTRKQNHVYKTDRAPSRLLQDILWIKLDTLHVVMQIYHIQRQCHQMEPPSQSITYMK